MFFNKKLKKEIATLNAKVDALNSENNELKISLLKIRDEQFLKNNSCKYKVGDKVKQGVIIEKRIHFKKYQKSDINQTAAKLIGLISLDLLLRLKYKNETFEHSMDYIKKYGFWEYRVKNTDTNTTSSWIAESEIIPMD